MPSVSFDRIAEDYDASRGYPPGVDQQIARAIEDAAHATPRTSFLEVGIGTGRIAFPLASLGHIYTGVDISEKMMNQFTTKLVENGWLATQHLWGSQPDEDSTISRTVQRYIQQEKHASIRLVQSDMTALPFKDGSFDVVVAVHVFHLVDGWRQALGEVLRVVRPGGLFLHCGDKVLNEDPVPIQKTWSEIVRSLGGDISRPGTISETAIADWLRARDLQLEELRTTRWETMTTPREAMENVTKRLWSGSWNVPEDIFATSIKRVEAWTNSYFGDKIDTPYKKEHQFVIYKVEVR